MKKLNNEYNSIVLVKDLGIGKSGRREAIFICKYCKSNFECQVSSIKSGNTKSCGCATKKLQSDSHIKHGGSKRSGKDALYVVWRRIKQRCYDKNSPDYKWYGAKGVKVCSAWLNNYLIFKEWALSNGYKKGLHIDKDKLVKGNKIYSPETCCFITPLENKQSRYKELSAISKTGTRWIHKHKNGTYFGKRSIDGVKYLTTQFKTKEEAMDELNNKVNKYTSSRDQRNADYERISSL